jgi:hypothetical protein
MATKKLMKQLLSLNMMLIVLFVVSLVLWILGCYVLKCTGKTPCTSGYDFVKLLFLHHDSENFKNNCYLIWATWTALLFFLLGGGSLIINFKSIQNWWYLRWIKRFKNHIIIYHSKNVGKFVTTLLDAGLLYYTIPAIQFHRNQKYFTVEDKKVSGVVSGENE